MENLGDTICGYQLTDLILFARACRAAGVTENELHDFALNYEYAFNFGLARANVVLIDKINEINKGD